SIVKNRRVSMPQSVLDQAKFWSIVKYLVELDEKKSFDEMCGDLEIHKHQLNAFVAFLKEVSFDLEYNAGSECIIPPKDKPSINIEFNLLEWLQFQAHFPALSSLTGKPYFEEFKHKLYEVEHEYSGFDLFNSIDKIEAQTDFQEFLEEATKD